MKTDRQKLIDRVVKLLALSESTTYSAEAEAAKLKAARLMAEHDIKLMEDKSEYEIYEEELTRAKLKKYDAGLINIISDFNGVKFITRTGGKVGFNIFVGKGADLLNNDYMLDIIRRQRQQAWKNHAEAIKREHGMSPSKKYRNQWFMGYTVGVREKLRELTASKECIIEQEMGLVAVSRADRALRFYEQQKGYEVKHTKGRPSTYQISGKEAGKEVQINKGISEASRSAFRLLN